ncbi:hypothetical protein BO82DRAFT_399017 [Aspergillus uvarum CBS 121591]|uniref:Uncharacterized protein n=1 Tax=Aspergillus uvarum CBS 121591 TaxID=1448315 RepID=A0A319CKV5_9EURO|nr:hypothetical protein BO82DRAFT_399017 [Aspergillus uvarum CBS 121591]PYH85069.1 hypothetical protein BO82DRAFT_399017 [Aspergillus uvarum CBS 121591]
MADGMHNKAIRFTMDNRFQGVGKVPNPNAGLPHFTTASEVATMDFGCISFLPCRGYFTRVFTLEEMRNRPRYPGAQSSGVEFFDRQSGGGGAHPNGECTRRAIE